jgi:hypothetical protein
VTGQHCDFKVLNFPKIPVVREERLNKFFDDERFHRLLDKIPAASAGILRRIMVLGVITSSLLFDVCFTVPVDEIERYQFLRLIQLAPGPDAVVDRIISDVETVNLQSWMHSRPDRVGIFNSRVIAAHARIKKLVRSIDPRLGTAQALARVDVGMAECCLK